MKNAEGLTVGRRIMMVRKKLRYSRQYVAEQSGISTKFLYDIEMDIKGLSAKNLAKLSKTLNVSMDYIMTGESRKKYNDEIEATLEMFKPQTLNTIERLLHLVYELTQYGHDEEIDDLDIDNADEDSINFDEDEADISDFDEDEVDISDFDEEQEDIV